MAKFPTSKERVTVRSRRKKHLTVKQKVMKRERNEFRKMSGTTIGSGKKFKFGSLVRIESFILLLLLVVFGGMIRHYANNEEEYQYLEVTNDVIEFDESMWDDLESGVYQENVTEFGAIGVRNVKNTFTNIENFVEFMDKVNLFKLIGKIGRWFGL
jgi:hypothetical protein